MVVNELFCLSLSAATQTATFDVVADGSQLLLDSEYYKHETPVSVSRLLTAG